MRNQFLFNGIIAAVQPVSGTSKTTGNPYSYTDLILCETEDYPQSVRVKMPKDMDEEQAREWMMRRTPLTAELRFMLSQDGRFQNISVRSIYEQGKKPEEKPAREFRYFQQGNVVMPPQQEEAVQHQAEEEDDGMLPF